MIELEFTHQDSEETSNWQKLRDAKVHEARQKAEGKLHTLDEKISRLNYRKGELENIIATLPDNPMTARVHILQSRRWLLLFLLTLGICIGSAWWTVDWFMTLTWERALLAVTLFILPVIGWMVLLTVMEKETERWNLKKIFGALAFLIILSSFTAIGCLGAARMKGVALQEEISQERAGEMAENFEQNAEGRAMEIAQTKALLNLLGMIAVIFLSLASETAAGIAYHQYWYHRLRVKVSTPYMRKHKQVLNRLSRLCQQHIKTKQKPDMLYATLTKRGIRHDLRKDSIIPVLKWVGILFVFALLLMVFGAVAYGSTTVAMVDLSKSMSTLAYKKHVETVTYLIRETKGVQMRIVVFGIGEGGFASEPLLDSTTPHHAGKFNEYLEGWQHKTIGLWKTIMAGYDPTAKRSDILGTLLRIGVEYKDAPKNGLNAIYFFSDMRQVGKRLNFEKRVGELMPILDSLEKQDLIPDLSGVDVWILGVHTKNVSEKRWLKIREFWRQYFQRANATLKMYSPSYEFR